MKTSRLEEIQRMFDQMGLGTQKERERLLELSGASMLPETALGESEQQQVFIRLENATSTADEVQHG